MTPDRIRLKAAAYATAWERLFGSPPSTHNTALGLSVALAETKAGDSWIGPDGVLDTADDPRNWGASTLRALNAAELAAVEAAGIKPTVGPEREERARAAKTAIVLAGLPLPQGEIHCDSRPTSHGSVAYFTFFRTSTTDVDGAEYFLRILAGTPDRPKPARVILESGSGTEHDLAAAMYSAHYFLGRHDPAQPGGAQRNIDDYISFIRPWAAAVRAALIGEDDTIPPPPHPAVLAEGSRGPAVLRLQQKIMVHDGSFGPVTTAALKVKQRLLGLPETGVLDEATKKKLCL